MKTAICPPGTTNLDDKIPPRVRPGPRQDPEEQRQVEEDPELGAALQLLDSDLACAMQSECEDIGHEIFCLSSSCGIDDEDDDDDDDDDFLLDQACASLIALKGDSRPSVQAEVRDWRRSLIRSCQGRNQEGVERVGGDATLCVFGVPSTYHFLEKY